MWSHLECGLTLNAASPLFNHMLISEFWHMLVPGWSATSQLVKNMKANVSGMRIEMASFVFIAGARILIHIRHYIFETSEGW